MIMHLESAASCEPASQCQANNFLAVCSIFELGDTTLHPQSFPQLRLGDYIEGLRKNKLTVSLGTSH